MTPGVGLKFILFYMFGSNVCLQLLYFESHKLSRTIVYMYMVYCTLIITVINL